MANIDNNCSDLELTEKYGNQKDHLAALMELQKDIQENVYGYNFEEMRNGPMRKLLEFWQWNEHAVVDELHEAFDALGGMHDGIKNASWKPWKKDHAKMDEISLSDMSERDLKELKFELVDLQHFVFNMMISIGMDAKDLYEFYWSKNQENRERQKRSY